ncbi:hypothetical protein C5167_029847 [Papaver somniferum]|nr:hypothetical protein C5167_029847 [Papaver somniferum]
MRKMLILMQQRGTGEVVGFHCKRAVTKESANQYGVEDKWDPFIWCWHCKTLALVNLWELCNKAESVLHGKIRNFKVRTSQFVGFETPMVTNFDLGFTMCLFRELATVGFASGGINAVMILQIEEASGTGKVVCMSSEYLVLEAKSKSSNYGDMHSRFRKLMLPGIIGITFTTIFTGESGDVIVD